MGITLQNAMKIGKFQECEVAAGHQGLSNVVESVTIMEVPNIVKLLKGKELLLTSLYSIKEDELAQRSLIQSLHDAGISGLAIKPFETLENIPEVILQSADQLGFPVISIPDHVKYLDILSPVMHAIFDEKIVLQEDLEQANRLLNEISLNSQGIEVFLKTVGSLTKNVVTVESQFPFMKIPIPELDISPLSQADIHELAFNKHPIHCKRRFGDKVVPCIVAPILVDGQLYGNITSWGTNSDHLGIDLAILERASSLLSIEFLRLKVKYDVEQQYKNDFLRELLMNESMNEKDLMEWGEKYNLSNRKKYSCFLISGEEDISDTGALKKIHEIDYILKLRWHGVMVGHIRNWICIIFPVGSSADETNPLQFENVFKHLRYYTGNRMIKHIGVGRAYQGVHGIRMSFLQAEKAIKLRISTKIEDSVLYYDDLGVYRLLSQMTDKKELTDFYEETVGKLVNYDQEYDLKLVETLCEYFDHDENSKETSKSMFIHVNTLKYRLQKIELLTGCNLHRTEGKMMLYIGLKILKMLGK